MLSEWAGLGYYARARNLIACARASRRDGRIPAQRGGASRALRASAPTRRRQSPRSRSASGARRSTPMSRGCSAAIMRSPIPAAGNSTAHVATSSPRGPPGDLVQAMMDLGATICVPREPRAACLPAARSAAALSPRARPRPSRRASSEGSARSASASPGGSSATARLWLVRRPPRGLLGGMAALPGDDWPTSGEPAAEPIARGAPRLHPFRARARRSSRRRDRSARAGGSRSTRLARRASDALSARRRRRCLARPRPRPRPRAA